MVYGFWVSELGQAHFGCWAQGFRFQALRFIRAWLGPASSRFLGCLATPLCANRFLPFLDKIRYVSGLLVKQLFVFQKSGNSIIYYIPVLW